ncbi:MAG: SDR family oxidoreductase [Verrucomicrobiota bacterium]
MKKIVLTGVTRGLGAALARYFSEQGHVVLGCGRSQENVLKIQKELGEPHMVEVVDVADDEAVKQWAEHIMASYEAPDFLINNAALMNKTVSLWEVPVENFDAVVDVNIKGVANVIRHFVPAMVMRKRGVIINFSSGWGRSVSPDVAPYCATKWAIEGLTKALAHELPQGMAAVPLNPGIIDTDMLRSCWQESAGAYPTADEWVKKAGSKILKVEASDNGVSLSV